MAQNFKIEISYNALNLGLMQNSFALRNTLALPVDDAQLLDTVERWIEAIYAPLQPFMDTGIVVMGGAVNEMTWNGTEWETMRVVGSFTPAITGTNNAEGLALTTAMSSFARTNTPKVRGSKRFGGITETHLADALFLNGVLAGAASATAAWIGGPAALSPPVLGYATGVLSTKLGAFAQFSGTGRVTNIPGTQVTRKPRRGA